MADFEDPRYGTVFEELMQASGVYDAVPTVDDLPVAKMDGQQIALDVWEGEDLRSALLMAYAAAKSTVITGAAEVADGASHIAREMYREIVSFQQGAFMGKLLAIEGADYFQLPSLDGNNITADFLYPAERLFGVVGGTALGEYVTVNPSSDAVVGLWKYDEQPAHLVGGMLCIRGAVVCEAAPGATGQIDRVYEEVYVPIHAHGLRWYSAYPKL